MSSALLVALALALASAWTIHVHGTWLAPGALFLCMWSAILSIAALTFPDVPETTLGFIWIALACLSFEGGAWLQQRTSVLSRRSSHARVPSIRGVVLAITLTGLILVVVILARGGLSLRELSVRAIIQLTVVNRSDKYAGLNPQTRLEWLSYVTLYFGTLLGGWLFGESARFRDRVLALMPLVIIAVVFLLYGSRFGALYGGIFWIAGYITAAVLSATRTADPSSMTGPSASAGTAVLRVAATAATLVFALSVLTQLVRYGGAEHVGWRAILADAFSYPVAFSIWISDHPFTAANMTAGARAFAKVTGVLGLSVDPLPAIPVGFTSSNIYTVFRDLVEDFGSIGMLVLLACAGRIAQAAFDATSRGSLVAAAVLVVAYASVFSTAAVSIFFYAAPTLALLVFFLYMCTPKLREVLSMSSRDG